MSDPTEIVSNPAPNPAPEPEPPAALTQNIVNLEPRHKFTFPPWPTPPEGVTIMPFKSFKQRGIQIAPGPDDEEVDTLGIVTVAVKTRHGTDECKTDTKRKKRLEEQARKAADGIKKDLWEQWEDRESARMSTAHVHILITEKLQQAAADFKVGRPWPKGIDSQHDPERIWQQFLHFSGLGDGVATSQPKKSHIKVFKQRDDDEEPLSDEDDEDGELVLNANVKERKILAFADNPDRIVKIFMSSYARLKGLIWAEDNLKAIPRLMGFWIDFLIRNKVLLSSEHLLKLRRAKETINLALKEYPLTAKIGKAIPDEFSAGCHECWGMKADGYKTLSLDIEADAPAVPAENGTIPEEEDVTMAAEISEVTTETPEVSGWGADATPSISEATQGWSAPDDGGWGDTGTDTAWDTVWDTSAPPVEPSTDEFVWSSSKPCSLLPLLGPTALPLTHTPGIVESSMRRIKSIVLPPPTVATAPVAEGPDADAVELDLEKQFARVVLSPWLNWEGGEVPAFSSPRILESSVGDVVDPLAPPVEGDGAGAKKPHDPNVDDITVLLQTSTAEDLSEGVGLAGTWVQLARVPKVAAEARSDGEPPAKKKKKSKSKSNALKKGGYWYVDDLTVIVPSFWAVSSGG